MITLLAPLYNIEVWNWAIWLVRAEVVIKHRPQMNGLNFGRKNQNQSTMRYFQLPAVFGSQLDKSAGGRTCLFFITRFETPVLRLNITEVHIHLQIEDIGSPNVFIYATFLNNTILPSNYSV